MAININPRREMIPAGFQPVIYPTALRAFPATVPTVIVVLCCLFFVCFVFVFWWVLFVVCCCFFCVVCCLLFRCLLCAPFYLLEMPNIYEQKHKKTSKNHSKIHRTFTKNHQKWRFGEVPEGLGRGFEAILAPRGAPGVSQERPEAKKCSKFCSFPVRSLF